MNRFASNSIARVECIDEWTTKIFEGVSLSSEDRRLVNELTETKKLEIDDLTIGLRVRSKSWIGVVRLSGLEIQVHPKLSGDNVRVIEMIEMTQGLDILRRMPGLREIDTTGKSLVDLLAMMLIHETERLVRGGLLSDYVERVDDLPVVRGRIMADRQILERFGQVDRVICQFDDRSQDIPENQLLTIGTQLCSRFASSAALRRKSRELVHILHQTCNPSAFDIRLGESQLAYNRMNSIYKDAHQLCWLIIKMCGVKDFFESSTIKSFAFMLNMNLLFEEFIYSAVKQILLFKEWRVSKQDSTKSIVWNATRNRSYARVRPDIVIRNRLCNSALTVDSKYKLYDFKKISSADIYQSFLYAFGYQHGQDGNTPRSVLVFPTTGRQPSSVSLEVRAPDKKHLATVQAIGIQIPELIDELVANEDGPNTICLRQMVSISLV